jgi:hypothetical protein
MSRSKLFQQNIKNCLTSDSGFFLVSAHMSCCAFKKRKENPEPAPNSEPVEQQVNITPQVEESKSITVTHRQVRQLAI